MAICCFCRFKGGFIAPAKQDKIEEHETTLKVFADYIYGQLLKENIRGNKPVWEGFQYFLEVYVANLKYEVFVGFDFVDFEWFEIIYKPHYGVISKFFGKTEQEEMRILSRLLHKALKDRIGVNEIRWYLKPYGNPDKDYERHPILE